MRVYLESAVDTFGVTQATDIIPKAVIISYSRLKSMSKKDKDAFAMKGKKRFVIAMPGQLENPSAADVASLLRDTGVNAIPINLIGTDVNVLNAMIAIWAQSKPYYNVKQMILQSFKTGVVPSQPSISMI
jgi:hypothetical protein